MILAPHRHVVLIVALSGILLDCIPLTSIMVFERVIRLYRSCLFQIIIVGLVAFCEPGIWTALNNLGAGGNAKVSHRSVKNLLNCR